MENIYGLIGKTLGHSFSQKYFTKKFAEERLYTNVYSNFEIGDLQQKIPGLKANPHIRGLNVTIPYKTEIIGFVDTITDTVACINACNCIEIKNGFWIAHNTDVIGFEKSFTPLLQPIHKKALVLGTGGASAAVQFVLKKLEIPYLKVSRTGGGNAITYEQVNESLLGQYQILINTTPLGMYPNEDSLPLLPYEALTSQYYLYDLVYNPSLTQFLRMGERAGATVKNGLEMLEIQANEAWKIWNG